jgi:hypothetical protein
VAGLEQGLVTSPVGPVAPTGLMSGLSDVPDDASHEQALALVAGERLCGRSVPVAGVLTGPGDSEEGLGSMARVTHRDQDA